MDAITHFLRTTYDLLALPILVAYVGRLAWHTAEVQRGRRRFFSIHLLWELVAAIAIGLVADGVAAHLGLVGAPRTAAIVALAYLGPRGLEDRGGRLLAARKGGA